MQERVPQQMSYASKSSRYALQLQTQVAPQHANLPWWATRQGGAASAAGAVAAPPSPLTQQLRSAEAQQIPIFNLPAMPDSGVWR